MESAKEPAGKPAAEASSGTPFEGTLAEEVQGRGRERWLSTLLAPEEKREMLLALHAYDLEQQHVVGGIEDPLLAEIRLAWWREQLEAMAKGTPPERHPTLEALGRAQEGGVDLAAFAALGEGLLPVLGEEAVDARKLATARGVPLFQAVAELLVPASPERARGAVTLDEMAQSIAAAGHNWGLSLLVRGGWGRRAARLADLRLPEALPVPGRLPRPLAVLARLAAEDVARSRAHKPLRWEGAPARLWKMLFAALRS